MSQWFCPRQPGKVCAGRYKYGISVTCVCQVVTVTIRFDPLNLQYCSRGRNPLNHKTKCIVTEQGGWKVTASSDHVTWRGFRRGQIIPLLCTTWSALENVSVHPQKFRESPASDVALDTGASHRILLTVCWTSAWFAKVERRDCGGGTCVAVPWF